MRQEPGGGVRHDHRRALGVAPGAEAPAFTGEGQKDIIAAFRAAVADHAEARHSAFAEFFEGFHHEGARLGTAVERITQGLLKFH